ncbi:MAG: N-acetyltransferase [Pseudomonadota bacterium]
MMFADFLRPMQPGEEGDVQALLEACFENDAEARLVQALRKAGDVAGEMVLPKGDEVIGYYALSTMRSPASWLALAPVAVHPDHQGRGHGRRMLGQLTAWARAAGQWVVVVGEPALYTRCGFDLGRAARLTSPYPITYTLLAGPGEDVPEVRLQYPKAFEAL